MRQLVSVRTITDIQPIPKADAIEVATIDGGWKVVVKKGDFSVGENALYIEIDSWVPNFVAPFLSKGKEPKVYQGIPGERLRTIKLRGQVSQGLLLPLTVLGPRSIEELLIIKWEREIPAELAGVMKGSFPSFIPKTDQERVQNLKAELDSAIAKSRRFEVTEKLEGSSMTVYWNRGEFGVCSRNIDLERDEHNAFWKMAIELDLESIVPDFYKDANIAIQGELVGPGIQGNIYNLEKREFYVFDIYDIDAGEYLLPIDRWLEMDALGLKHVPIVANAASLYDSLGIKSLEDVLIFADGQSQLGIRPSREGLVFKDSEGGMSFKAISNRYLLSEK